MAFLSQNIGESLYDQVGDEMLTQNPETGKKVKQKCLMTRACRINQWSHITMIKLIQWSIYSQTKMDQTCRKTEWEPPPEMKEIEQDFDVAEKLGPEEADNHKTGWWYSG